MISKIIKEIEKYYPVFIQVKLISLERQLIQYNMYREFVKKIKNNKFVIKHIIDQKINIKYEIFLIKEKYKL